MPTDSNSQPVFERNARELLFRDLQLRYKQERRQGRKYLEGDKRSSPDLSQLLSSSKAQYRSESESFASQRFVATQQSTLRL